MREPVIPLQKEDKRKAALSIFNLSKMRLPSHSRQYKGFYLGDNSKGKLVPKDIWFDEEKLFQDAVCIALKDLKRLKKIKLLFKFLKRGLKGVKKCKVNEFHLRELITLKIKYLHF